MLLPAGTSSSNSLRPTLRFTQQRTWSSQVSGHRARVTAEYRSMLTEFLLVCGEQDLIGMQHFKNTISYPYFIRVPVLISLVYAQTDEEVWVILWLVSFLEELFSVL